MNQRILLFLPNLAGGGAERVMVQLANEFAVAGFETHLAVADSTSTQYIDEVQSAVSLQLLGTGGVMRAVRKLSALIETMQPAVLFTTMGHTAVACHCAMLLARGGRPRFLVREAISVDYKLSRMSSLKCRLVDWAVKQVYRRADVIVAPSATLMQALVGHYGLRNRKAVIANPVLVDGFESRLHESLEIPLPWQEDARVFIGMGRFVQQKEFATLIRAFAALQVDERCKLLILGEGKERAALEQLVTELGLSERCWLPGFVSNPFPYLARAQVFVLSSRFEGLPNALIQAYAAGAVCVATDCPTGPEEILEGGQLGRLVPVADVEAMSQAMALAMEEAISRDSGQREEQFLSFKQRYDSAEIAGQYLALMGLSPSLSS